MFLGLVLAVISMWTQRKAATAATLSVPLLALGLPLLDTSMSFARRLLSGRSPFSADKEHVHHRLMAIGLNHRSAVLTMYTVSAVFCLGALALLKDDPVTQTIVYLSVGSVCIVLVRKIGFLRLPTRIRASVEHIHHVRTAVRSATRRIRSASDRDQVLAALYSALATLGAKQAELHRDRGSDLFDGRLKCGSAADSHNYSEVERTISNDLVQFGSLTLALREEDVGNPNVEVCIELLCEAMVEFESRLYSEPPVQAVVCRVVDLEQACSSA